MTIETFKILNNMSPHVLSDLINLRENSTYNFWIQKYFTGTSS